jgi:GNAT superfamily N-acetyltransferase
MSYTVEEVIPAEFAATFAEVEARTFSGEELSRIAWGPQVTGEELQKRLAKRADTLAKPATAGKYRMTKAVAADGTVVGAAHWSFYLDQPMVVPKISEEEQLEKWKENWGNDGNHDFCLAVFGESSRNMDRHFDGKHFASEHNFLLGSSFIFRTVVEFFLGLNCLFVLPEYQRRGIGKLLLADGLKLADEAGVPVWLGASPSGYGLYLKHGFEEDLKLDIDFTKYGGVGESVHYCMIRPGKSPLVVS